MTGRERFRHALTLGLIKLALKTCPADYRGYLVASVTKYILYVKRMRDNER